MWYSRIYTITLDLCTTRRFSLVELRETLRHVNTLKMCVRVLKKIAEYYADIENIMNILCNAFKLLLPSEYELRTLSRLQQESFGLNNDKEFAITTIWVCAQQSIVENFVPRCIYPGLMRRVSFSDTKLHRFGKKHKIKRSNSI